MADIDKRSAIADTIVIVRFDIDVDTILPVDQRQIVTIDTIRGIKTTLRFLVQKRFLCSSHSNHQQSTTSRDKAR